MSKRPHQNHSLASRAKVALAAAKGRKKVAGSAHI